MKRVTILVNKIINSLKYPLALIMAFLTFELSTILYDIIQNINRYQSDYKYLFMGMGIYIFLWFMLFKRKRMNWFFTIEHELTHSLFAILTFHTILDFYATNGRGGFMRYVGGAGGGNWLITIAPYFFPTFSMIIIGLIYFSQPKFYPLLVGLLGYSVVYHIHSTYKETEIKQPDIQNVGLPFSFLFLPSANLLAMIGILSAIPNDGIEFMRILDGLYYYLSYHFHSIIFYLTSY